MSEVRWLGPYAPEDRHADKQTVDHIIALRKQLELSDKAMNNALDGYLALRDKERIFRYALNDIASKSSDPYSVSVAMKAFEEANDA